MMLILAYLIADLLFDAIEVGFFRYDKQVSQFESNIQRSTINRTARLNEQCVVSRRVLQTPDVKRFVNPVKTNRGHLHRTVTRVPFSHRNKWRCE
jgi:hypothetical protein